MGFGMSSLVRALVLVSLAQASQQAQYEATTLGFVTAFKRPFVLLRTAMGVQTLERNRTFYNNRSSLYYASESTIDFMAYNSESNYLLTVENDTMCLRNLIKSEWNSEVRRNFDVECQKKEPFMSPAQSFSLSFTRQLLFVLTEQGSIKAVAIRRISCIVSFETTYAKAKLLHATNFAHGPDYLLVGEPQALVILSLDDGKYKQKYELNHTLRAIDSDQEGNFFVAIESDSEVRVLLFKEHLPKAAQVIRIKTGYKVASLSVSQHMMAILLTKDQITFQLHLVNSSSAKNGEQSAIVYHCDHCPDLQSLLLVGQQVQPSREICKLNPAICKATLGGGQFCDLKRLFHLSAHTTLNETEIESELLYKSLLTGSLGIVCLLVMLLAPLIKAQY